LNILFYFGHPSQYLFVSYAIRILKKKGVTCDIIIKSKDVLERLLQENNESFYNILPEGRKSSRSGILLGLLKRDIRLFQYTHRKHYDLFVGTDPSLAHIGFLKNIPVITVLEDDISVIPELARITFPFSTIILTPSGCDTGKYKSKTIRYDGYMKLAYLHPTWFEKKRALFKQPYYLIRVSGLEAHHDFRISGLNFALVYELIGILKKKGTVYISSEGKLNDQLLPYLLKINPVEMQHVLSGAEMLISDSQSMSMEAAMLGVPSVRFNDFAGRISVLEELEHKYGLTFGLKSNSSEKLFDKINELLSIPDLRTEFENRRQIMLKDKIDVTEFLVWFFDSFPESIRTMKENPGYQNRFKN
jgi:uncharacterized protein